MKAIRILTRSIRDSFKSVFRNFSLSLASISCIAITLIVVAISLILTYNVNNFTSKVERDVTIVAFLDTNIKEEGRQEILEKLKKMEGLQNITYESKTKIGEEMMNSSDIFKNIMKNWDESESPLQDTYLIKVENIKEIGSIAKRIENLPGVDIVKYGEGMVEQLVSLFDLVRKICYGMVIALIIVTAFLIANTIKITIFSRRREIDIMRLVGASNINIKIPFVFEGLILGVLGSIIPIITTTYGYTALYEKFHGQLFSSLITLIKPQPFVFQVSLVLLIIGILVGMFGSWRAVRKYLKI